MSVFLEQLIDKVKIMEKCVFLLKRQVVGELFALTGKYFPFTGPINESYTMIVKQQQELQEAKREAAKIQARGPTSVFERIKQRFFRRYFP